MYIDLHIHTDSSDGTWNVGELFSLILNSDISLFSITDHDTIENSQLMMEMVDESSRFQGKYVIGSEISCSMSVEEWYHITAYAFDPDNTELQELLKTNQKLANEAESAAIKKLSLLKPEITFGEYQAYQHNPKRGGYKSLNFLIDKGIVHNISEFNNLMKSLDFKLQYLNPQKVISIIRNAGGFPFLAHPNAYLKGEPMPDDELLKWIDIGIGGIECYSPYCNVQDSEKYVNFCKRHSLLISAGSDSHGTFTSKRKLGHPRVTREMLKLGFI